MNKVFNLNKPLKILFGILVVGILLFILYGCQSTSKQSNTYSDTSNSDISTESNIEPNSQYIDPTMKILYYYVDRDAYDSVDAISYICQSTIDGHIYWLHKEIGDGRSRTKNYVIIMMTKEDGVTPMTLEEAQEKIKGIS